MKNEYKIGLIACAMAAVFASSCGEETSSVATTRSTLNAAPDMVSNPDTMDLHGFDISPTGATATLLGLGVDVAIGWDGNFTFHPSTGSNADWRYAASTQLARGGQAIKWNATRVVREDHVLKLVGDGLIKQFTHQPEGLAVAYTVTRRPVGDGDLTLNIWAPSYSHEVQDGSVQVFRGSEYQFLWKTFAAWDSNHVPLPVRIDAKGERLTLTVDDRGAAYPITIDPVATTPFWVKEGDTSGERFGFRVAMGDVTGDGLADVLVSQQRYSQPETQEGRILLFPGTATGVSSTAAWTYESNQTNAFLGTAQVVGDINGDNIADFATSATSWDGTEGVDVGIVVLFAGGDPPSSTPLWTFEGPAALARIGNQITGEGDFNCDGNNDVAVASVNEDSGDGKVRIFLNTGTGLPTLPSTTLSGPAGRAENFGSSVAFANINGDSVGVNECDDLVVSSPSYDVPTSNQGQLQVFFGSVGPVGAPQKVTSGSTSANLGLSLSSAHDINGDGFDDLIAGANFYSGTVVQEGAAYVYYGSSTGLQSAVTILAGGSTGSRTGSSVTSGDFNGDGFSDVAVGANEYSNPESKEGRVRVYQGTNSGITTTPSASYETDTVNAYLGDSLASGEDLNGDGVDDLLAGARAYSSGPLATVGAVFAFGGVRDCRIGNVFVANGEVNPMNPCEQCDVATSQTAWTPAANGVACSDGDACTTGDSCQAGVCTSGPATVCSDGNACTSDTCDPATGACAFDDTALEGSSCTAAGPTCVSNTCQSGTCAPNTITGCLINNTCVADGATNPANPCEVCNAAADQTAWSLATAGTTCNDGLFCTVNDVCDATGSCGGSARDCSSAAAECFTATSCDEANDQCVPSAPAASGTACGGDLCTTNGMCDGAGACTGTAVDCTSLDSECMVGVCNLLDGSCQAQSRVDGTGCDDGDACTTADSCTAGVCAGAAVDCSTLDAACSVGVCDAATGACQAAPTNEGGACDDGDMCTENDICGAGTCAGVAVTCDDGSSCTADSCDTTTGCVFTTEADGTACTDDNLSCTADTCQAGICTNVLAQGCLIGNACIDDGALDPNAACQICDPSVDPSGYTNAAVGTPCPLTACSEDGLSVLAGACDATGTCSPAVVGAINCAPYRCDAAACLTACSTSAECQDGFECQEAQCVEPTTEDMGNGDAGDMGNGDAGDMGNGDAGDMGNGDADTDVDSQLRGTELTGSGCACSSASGVPSDVSWIFAMVGLFALRIRHR